jgi:hypothetical protein
MIAIHIDPRLEKIDKEIRYSFDLLFQTLGYSYRFITDMSQAESRDILVLYWLLQPSTEELLALAKYNVTLFIPSEPALLQKGQLSNEQMQRNMREIKLRTKTPIISEKKVPDIPLEIYSQPDVFGGKFNFDLIGNLYFHLTGTEEMMGKKPNQSPDTGSQDTIFSEFRVILLFIIFYGRWTGCYVIRLPRRN